MESPAECTQVSLEGMLPIVVDCMQVPAKSEPTPKNIVRVSPAVPAVLFQGVKLPKIATPPQRTSREVADVPEFPSSDTGPSSGNSV